MQTSTCQAVGECRMPEHAVLPQPLYREVVQFIDALPQKEGHLVTVLHKAQSVFGYLPIEVQQFVADHMEVPLAQVYGVVSFYTFFTMVPKGDPVAPYIKRQGRFRHLTAAQIVSIQEQVDARWRALEARVHGSETRV